MTLPTPVKTWLISPNNTLTSNVGPTDYVGRSRDLADFFGTVVSQLLALSASLPTPITVVGSSDGASNISPPALTGMNYWIPGSASFKQKLNDYFFGSSPSLWVVLQFGTPQLAFCFEQATNQFTARWSETGSFAAPVSSNVRPVAGDEVLLWYTSAGYYQNYGNFNMDNQGIINGTNNYLNYTQQVHIGLADDLSGFYAVSYRSQVLAQIIWFGSLQNAVWMTPPYNWSAARVMLMSGNLRFRQYAGQYNEGTTNGWQPRATLDSNGVFLLPPAIPNIGTGSGSSNTCYADVPLNALIYNGTVDLDTNAFPLSNVSLYSPARYGLKGTLTDVWFGPANGNTYTYPASAPLAPDFFQANEFVLPWDGTTAILFA